MAIITFYSTDYKETGQTVSMAAIITYMAIKHNYKMLGISTSFRDITLENCFWKQENESNTNAKFLNSNLVGVCSGIEGLSKVLIANRSSENLVTNYARVVFKDRLEILSSPQVKFYSDYRKICESYPMAIEESKKNYDLVFVDLSKRVPENIRKQILEISDIIIINLVTRFLREKSMVSVIPYNTLFFESCTESKLPDFFLKLRNIDENDRNFFFIREVDNMCNNIIYKLKELQLKV